ncbi:hypothetical protein N7G274_006702 [Stereocaulon virgatum]|uniref:Uncharacterized protein n=1 Tax=Stereocaulon virgatum TaxID=373712 RepID=A0ABR4A4Y9_9LECA
MRSSTVFTLLMATSSPLAVLSGLSINYGGNSPSTSVDSATLTKPTPVSSNRKNIIAAPSDGVKDTATDTNLDPAMIGLNTSGSQKQYAPPWKRVLLSC